MLMKILRYGGNKLSNENSVIYDDILSVCSDNSIQWDMLYNKTVLVTGATGLIGKLIVKSLSTKGNISVIAYVRNAEKAEKCFRGYDNIKIIVGDILDITEIDSKIDYIIHGASVTDSKSFVNSPVDTVLTALNGTRNILELATRKKCSGMVYLSSMEVYGTPQTNEKINELYPTNLDTMSVRSCYPESKRACENLCCAYSSQYGIRVMTARLTQTFGAGVEYNDGRVFAEFARCSVENRDIILHTKGDTERCYLYTADAVRAILTILISGENCKAYNVANEETYCTIYEMAQLVAEKCSDEHIKVECIIEDVAKYGYANHLKMNLDTTEIKTLGWSPEFDLENMYKRMKESWK